MKKGLCPPNEDEGAGSFTQERTFLSKGVRAHTNPRGLICHFHVKQSLPLSAKKCQRTKCMVAAMQNPRAPSKSRSLRKVTLQPESWTATDPTLGPLPFPAKKQKFLLSMIHLPYHHQIANVFTYMSLL